MLTNDVHLLLRCSRDGSPGGVQDWIKLAAVLSAGDPTLADVQELEDLLESNEGTKRLWFEYDARIVLRQWIYPAVSPLCRLAKELSIGDTYRTAWRIEDDERVIQVSDAGFAEGLLQIARSPHLAPIEILRVSDANLEGDRLSELLSSPLGRGVQVLELPGCRIDGSDGARRIVNSPTAAELGMLDLSFCYIHHDGLDAIIDAPLPKLTSLKLGTNCIGMSGDEIPEGFDAYWDRMCERCAEREPPLEVTFV